MATVTTTITTGGAIPTPPATLLSDLIADATELDPGLTANLPGTLIEDVASTQTGALAIIDSAYVDLINSITPYTSNDGLTVQLGTIYGTPQGLGFNGSVNVVFAGPSGFVIPAGFKVTDGTNLYDVQDSAFIQTDGFTIPLFCVAEQSGTFAIPLNTVNQLASSVPTTSPPITCNNPTAGIPLSAAQPLSDYRAQVVQAGNSTAQGMLSFLKTQLSKVAGVQQRFISAKIVGSSYVVSAAGGDPYAMAGAIYLGISDPATLAGSTLGVISITQANPGVVTSDLSHGYTSGQVVQVNGALGMTAINGLNLTIIVLSPKTFSVGIDTTGFGAYTGDGILTPNLRNQSVAINDSPDTYNIPFVEPLQQLLGMQVTWSSNSTNFVNPDGVASATTPALIACVNGITSGQPFNILTAQGVFEDAVSTVLDPTLLTSLTFTVTIDGVVTAPDAGTDIVSGSAFSYFETFAALISVLPA